MADKKVKRFFPKIYFVDELPLPLTWKMIHRAIGRMCLGCYDHTLKEIHIYNGVRPQKCRGQFSTLIHELCHWAISTIFGNKNKLHDILDKK